MLTGPSLDAFLRKPTPPWGGEPDCHLRRLVLSCGPFIHGFAANHADRYKEGRRCRCAGDRGRSSSTSRSPPHGDGSFMPCARFLYSVCWAALAFVWLFVCLEEGEPVGSISIKDLAEGGQYFFYAISTTQLMVVLLVAPAATAGAICLDRARGNLTHMLVTDLADAEIVLGKLAARLLPVVALVAATIPVLALAGLLGGVIFEAIVSLTLITLALAIFGCSLALAISVRATKTHEVLMAVYGVESLWILSPLVWELLSSTRVVPGVPAWFVGDQSRSFWRGRPMPGRTM